MMISITLEHRRSNTLKQTLSNITKNSEKKNKQVPHNVVQANAARDALAKCLYVVVLHSIDDILSMVILSYVREEHTRHRSM